LNTFLFFVYSQQIKITSIKYPPNTANPNTQNKMSRIHCSQCGQVGHNRRNRNCPVNIDAMNIAQTFTMPPLTSQRTTLCRTRFLVATNALTELTQFISRTNDVSRSDYVLGVVVKTHLFCRSMNQALEVDTDETTPMISHEHIFEMLFNQVSAFNNILDVIIDLPIRLVVSLDGRHFNSTLSNPNPTTTVALKRTSAYLKEITLIQDFTITETSPNCDCTICFDEVMAMDVIATNCKHTFCGTCIKGFTTSIKDNTKKPDCPMCRCYITQLKIANQQVYNEIHSHILNL
jgi:hypothetical protein